ncbi:glycosyltransferase [Rhabdaerophilum sp.]|uniref:glycosyltransferase n=1 Tax=Rhabdaerophilum sp. TaxID=2717341 RepID=UPI0038D48B9A
MAYWVNLFHALPHLRNVIRDYTAIRVLRRDLRGRASELRSGSGVNALHFVYGLKSAENFPFYACMAVLSAQARHPAAKTFLYLHHEPTGVYWDLIKPRVEIVRIPDIDYFGFARIRHYAHKSDVIRLLALIEIGGLYLDCDSFTLANMDELAHHDYVVGVQQTIPGAMGGFCNAIMLGRRGSRFAKRWLRQYRSFRSSGRDKMWDFHSVKLPMYLYSRRRTGVHVLTHEKWFFPLWNHIDRFLFDPTWRKDSHDLSSEQYAIHLWHNMAFNALDEWSPERMKRADCFYADICTTALEALPKTERGTIMAALEACKANEAA